jgi:hypothetical protein
LSNREYRNGSIANQNENPSRFRATTNYRADCAPRQARGCLLASGRVKRSATRGSPLW